RKRLIVICERSNSRSFRHRQIGKPLQYDEVGGQPRAIPLQLSVVLRLGSQFAGFRGFQTLLGRDHRLQPIAYIYLNGLYKLTLARIELPGFRHRPSEVSLRGAVPPRKTKMNSDLLRLKILAEEVIQRLEVSSLEPRQHAVAEHCACIRIDQRRRSTRQSNIAVIPN